MSEHVSERAWALKVLGRKVGSGKRVEAARTVLYQRFGVREAKDLEWRELRRLVMNSGDFLREVEILARGGDVEWGKAWEEK